MVQKYYFSFRRSVGTEVRNFIKARKLLCIKSEYYDSGMGTGQKEDSAVSYNTGWSPLKG